MHLGEGEWAVSVVGRSYENGELVERITTDTATINVKPFKVGAESPFPEPTRTEIERIEGNIGYLPDLLTKDKTSIVNAINEVYRKDGSGGGGSGTDGFSPIIDITEIVGGHRVTITDKNGSQSFDVLNGEKGDPYTLTESDKEEIKNAVINEIPEIPTKTSQLDNDSGFVTEEETEKSVKYIDAITLGVDDVAIADNIVTLGTGWSGNVADGFTHASGSAEPLSFAINANDGEKFIVEYDTSVTGDYILLKLGNAESIENVYPTSPYNGTTAIQWGLVCSGDNGVLQIIPTSNFNGTITNIKVYKITENGEKEITVNLDNVGIGQLPNHIVGFYNFYLSPTSMQKSVNGTRNVAIGYASLRDIVSGGRNIGLGTFALASLIYGENNIAIGADAGLNLSLAENTVAIGKGAAAFGAKRTDDIAIGRYSLSGSKGTENTSKNVAIGVEAGRDCQSSGNVFIGTSAGAKATTSSNNVVIGNGAGNNITTGWGNTCIGANAKPTGNFSQVTVIGQGAQATKHKQAVFGNDSTVETVLKGDVVVRGTDGVYRKIIFNADGTCSWTETTV